MCEFSIGEVVCKVNTVGGKVVKDYFGEVIFCSDKSLIVSYIKDGIEKEEFVNLVRGYQPWTKQPNLENK